VREREREGEGEGEEREKEIDREGGREGGRGESEGERADGAKEPASSPTPNRCVSPLHDLLQRAFAVPLTVCTQLCEYASFFPRLVKDHIWAGGRGILAIIWLPCSATARGWAGRA
jgi:hypothetical protein